MDEWKAIKTKPALWAFIAHHFGLKLPHKVFTPGHSTPFAFVADAFFNPGQDLAAWANRSGLKTLCASVIAALEFRFADNRVKARVLAGSEDQAKNLYEYWCKWCWGLLRDKLDGEPQRLLTRLDNGDMQILAASQKRVRGAKVHKLFRDELDEIDPEIIGASVGMLASQDGIPARTVDTSTWHHPYGPMGQLVANADKNGIRLHKWGIWESLANCPPERHENGKNCNGCPLGAVCLKKAGARATVGIASKCHGLMAVDDAITQIRQWSLQQWKAEAECKRPSLQGLVYPQFDRAAHVKAGLDFDNNLPTFRAIDWGLNDFVCLWIQPGKTAIHIVDEYWAQDTRLAEHAKKILELDKKISVQATYCDPAGANRNDQSGVSDVQIFRSLGIPCLYRPDSWAREVRNGINLIRGYLQPAAGTTRLYLAGKCKNLIRAFESYRLRKVNGEYIDEPVKPQPCDHPLDAFRYYMVNKHAPARSEAKQWRYS